MVDITVTTLDGGEAGSVTLPDAIFGLAPRPDIVQRCVVWQLSRRQAGTHKVKNRAEIARTGKKMYRQKGTGGARHGSQRVNLFRGGGRSFGPVVRSHATELPKKVRALALRHALSAKAQGGGIVVVDEVSADGSKTKALKERFGRLGLVNALIVGGAQLDENFARAARNIPHVDVLPVQGINVYDIVRRDKLVLTRAALEAIEARFSGEGEGAGSRVREAASAAASTVSEAASAVAATVGEAASTVRETLSEAAEAVGSAMSGVVSSISGSGESTEGQAQ